MSTTMTTSSIRARTSSGRRALTVALAVVAALLVWAVCDPVAGVDLRVRSGNGDLAIGAVDVGLGALLVGCAGWALLGILERVRGRARTAWTSVALVVLVVSLIGPMGAVSVAACAGLLCLHVVVGLIILAGMRPTAC